MPAGAKSAHSLQGPESEVAVEYWLSFGSLKLVSISINTVRDIKMNLLHPEVTKLAVQFFWLVY